MVNYVRQHADYGLGNFVNLTPTIERMWLKTAKKVKVYFESEYIRDCFSDWPPIEVLSENPTEQADLCTSMINRANDCPDYEYTWKRYFDGKPRKALRWDKPMAAIICGCANDEKRHEKQPSIEAYKYIIDKLKENDYLVFFIGTDHDFVKSGLVDLDFDEVLMDNIRVMEWGIAHSDLIVANDTGLHHLAGMHGKKGFILWKDTKLPKNKSFNDNFFISHDWINDFDRWLKSAY